MRMIKITSVYREYIDYLYTKNIGLHNKSYSEQLQVILYDAFGWADFWMHALEPKGYEVIEILSNIETLQKKWAIENGIKFSDSNWLLDITKAQIISVKPEVLFMDDYSTFTFDWINEIKQECPSIRMVLGWCGAPYNNIKTFKAYDVVLSCIPELVTQFKENGCHSEHINHAFDPRILDRIDTNQEKDIDFSFVGQLVRANKYHKQRSDILEKIVDIIDIQIYTPSYYYGLNDIFKSIAKSGLYDVSLLLRALGFKDETLGKLPLIQKTMNYGSNPIIPYSIKLKKFMRQPVFGLKMFQTLYNSRITFNNHIAISPKSASNMRMFEATGAGACLLTDWKENIHDLFEPDKEVVTYKSIEECGDKVKWLMDHPNEMDKIAQAGKARTLKDHTFETRAEILNNIIKDKLSKK